MPARFPANDGVVPEENGTSKGEELLSLNTCWLNCVSGVMPLFAEVLETWLFLLVVCLNWMCCRPSKCIVIASVYDSRNKFDCVDYCVQRNLKCTFFFSFLWWCQWSNGTSFRAIWFTNTRLISTLMI
jgi:hypothetical protein